MNEPLTPLPTICIVGRPNVGKSTLFNRIIGRRKAVVHETSGTTRDRIEAVYEKDNRSFTLIDTGGLLTKSNDKISYLVKGQIEEAILEADLLLFVCDVRSGVTPQDEEVVSILRRSNKQVFLIINKVDNKRLEEGIYDFYKFGLGNPYPISAIHGRGITDLIDEMFKTLSRPPDRAPDEAAYKIAITGRPNVGKSLFLNTLLKKDRVIVDKAPGTTRDSIDTIFEKDGDLYLLIDTAGIRHKRKVKEPIDVYSMSRSREAIERSNVAFLLIDGYEGLRNDDVRVFNYIVKCGKCCVIVVNKWDLVKEIQMADYKNAIVRRAPTTACYPIVFGSAKTGRNLLSCIDMVKDIVASADQEIGTRGLNEFLKYLKAHSFKITKRNPKLHYMVQTAQRPPTFLIFVNDTRLVTEGFNGFIERALRKQYNFYGTPIRINYRSH